MSFDNDLLKEVKRRHPQALQRLRRLKLELEKDMNSDAATVYRLLAEPIIGSHEGKPVRRYRLMSEAGWLRLFFTVNIEKCVIRFSGYVIRRGNTYRKLRKRGKSRK